MHFFRSISTHSTTINNNKKNFIMTKSFISALRISIITIWLLIITFICLAMLATLSRGQDIHSISLNGVQDSPDSKNILYRRQDNGGKAPKNGDQQPKNVDP